MGSIRNNHKSNGGDDRRENAQANARARKDTAQRALAGAETVIDALDSAGNPIVDPSPLSIEEREAAKEALRTA